MSVRDKDSSVNAKLWDYKPDLHPHFKVGSVITVWATVDIYQGMPQLNIKQAEISLEDPMSFAKSTSLNVEEMWSHLVNLANEIKEPMTKYVTEEILIGVAESYKKAPAAKDVHNAWYGGLLEHSYAMCVLAKPVVNHYKQYCKNISYDKVIFGAIVHDSAKIIEFDLTNPSFNYTPRSVLTNHIVVGMNWVSAKAGAYKKLHPEMTEAEFLEESSHLIHIIGAHHGQLEWGSPMPPATVEAGIVHYLDYLDSQTMHIVGMSTGKPGPIKGFSERSYAAKTYIKLQS